MQAKLSDLATLANQARALAALRDELEKQAQDAAARAMTEQQRREAVQAQLADEKKLGDSARAQIALLNQQIDQLKSQLSSIAASLDLTQQQDKDKDAQIANLGQKLNVALAAKVEELQQYRSEFFGKLRSAAGEPVRHHRGRRPVRVPERGAVSGWQRRTDPGRRGADDDAGGDDQGHRVGDPAAICTGCCGWTAIPIRSR